MPEKDKQPKRRNRKPPGSSRLNATLLAALERFAPGFTKEYVCTHDATGKPLPDVSMEGLRYIGDDRHA